MLKQSPLKVKPLSWWMGLLLLTISWPSTSNRAALQQSRLRAQSHMVIRAETKMSFLAQRLNKSQCQRLVLTKLQDQPQLEISCMSRLARWYNLSLSVHKQQSTRERVAVDLNSLSISQETVNRALSKIKLQTMLAIIMVKMQWMTISEE